MLDCAFRGVCVCPEKFVLLSHGEMRAKKPRTISAAHLMDEMFWNLLRCLPSPMVIIARWLATKKVAFHMTDDEEKNFCVDGDLIKLSHCSLTQPSFVFCVGGEHGKCDGRKRF